MKNLLLILFVVVLAPDGFGQEKSIDCSNFKIGVFSFEKDNAKDVRITRRNSKQVEFHPKSKSKVISKIEWINDCEFILTCIRVNKPENKKYVGGKLTVKILSITENSYTYRATYENGLSKERTHYKLK